MVRPRLGADGCVPVDIELDAQAEKVLEESPCKAEDMQLPSFYRVFPFRLTVRENRVVTARVESDRFSPLLALTRENGQTVAIDFGFAQRGKTRVVSHLPPGTYLLLAMVRAFPDEPAPSGTFTVALSNESPRSCPTTDLTPGSELEGRLASDGCREVDAIPFSSSEAPVAFYRLTLTDRRVVSLTMSSTDVTAGLSVIDSSQRILASNRASTTGRDAAVVVSLNRGTYVVRALGRPGDAGAYRLNPRAEEPRVCEPVDLPLENSLDGRLDSTDCRILDLIAPSSANVFVKLFRFQAAEKAVLNVAMESADFDTLVAVFDDRMRVVGANDDGADDSNSKLEMSVRPGAYLVAATSYEQAIGRFRLAARKEAPRVCDVRTLGADEQVTGELSATGCRFLDLVAPSDDSTIVSPYKLTLAARSMITLSAKSTQFDTVLQVFDDALAEELTGNDDYGDGTDSWLDVMMLPGSYYVLVTTYDDYGSFDFSAKSREPRVCRLSQIFLSRDLDTNLGDIDCKLNDMFLLTPWYAYADPYAVNIAVPGRYSAEMSAAGFTSVVFIIDSSGRVVGRSTAADKGETAKAAANLTLGQYVVVATSFEDNTTGDYRLRVIPIATGATQ